jgi:hypothetical protein
MAVLTAVSVAFKIEVLSPQAILTFAPSGTSPANACI